MSGSNSSVPGSGAVPDSPLNFSVHSLPSPDMAAIIKQIGKVETK